MAIRKQIAEIAVEFLWLLVWCLLRLHSGWCLLDRYPKAWTNEKWCVTLQRLFTLKTISRYLFHSLYSHNFAWDFISGDHRCCYLDGISMPLMITMIFLKKTKTRVLLKLIFLYNWIIVIVNILLKKLII